jgi:hypothetical protein
VALCGAVVGVRCHRLVISTPPLDRLATIDGVGILNREFPVLNGLIHEHRISWGQIAYFYKGRVWSRLAGSV